MTAAHDDTDARLAAAVTTLWLEAGQPAPTGDDLSRAIAVFQQTLAAGRKIPRTADKTVQPLYGPRRDIEQATYRQGEAPGSAG